MGTIVFDEVQVIDLLRSNPVQVRSQPIERGDNMALRWTVDVRLGGKSVPSEGLAFAVYCARSDGVTVRGDDIRIEGSKIVTMIPQDAANVPGPVVCMLRLSGTDGENAALAWLSLTAVDTVGEAIIDQGTRLPSLEEMMAQTLRAAEAANKAEAAAGRAEAAIANAAGAAGAANTAAEAAGTAAAQAQEAAQGAATAANAADAAAQTAREAAQAIDAMTVDASGLAAGSAPTATVNRVDGRIHIAIGIPAGATGPQGATGAVPRITFEVATGAPGTQVQVEQSGTDEEPIVRLTIPRGDTGAIENLTINGKPVESGTITLTADDLGAATAEEVSQLKDDLSAEKTARKNADDVLSARMDTFTALSDGSTTGDAELADIRVGVDGNTYASAGAAVRGQISAVKNDLAEIDDDLSYVLVKSKNIVDTTKSVVGYLANNDGDIIESDIYKTTDYTPVENGKKYAISPRIRKLLVYREDKYPDYSFAMVDGWYSNYIFTAPRDGYIRVTYSTSEENIFQIEDGESVTPYLPYGYKEMVKYNPLKGKSVYCFGDSLMYGHVSGEGIIDGLCSENEMTLTKYAFNGANIVLSQEIETQVNNANADVPDFIIFDGLLNDATNASLYGVNLGELSTSFDATTFDTTTFYGAFEHLISTIRNKYITSNVIFVCCHKMPTRNYDGLIILQKAARECCEKWSVPYVDIFNNGQINCYIDSMRDAYSYNNEGETSGGNGTHLTGAGYNKWYAPLIKAKMLELLS